MSARKINFQGAGEGKGFGQFLRAQSQDPPSYPIWIGTADRVMPSAGRNLSVEEVRELRDLCNEALKLADPTEPPKYSVEEILERFCV